MKDSPLRAAVLSTVLAAALSGCGGANLWPFDGEGAQPQSRVPANATAYQCEGGKRFFARFAEGGASVWVILPEREFRLDRVASGGGSRYSNGKATLDTGGAGASLDDGPAAQFTGCKTATG